MSAARNTQPSPGAKRPLRVLMCFRAPLGGLFRHVGDLTQGLVARGAEVGIICDAASCGPMSDRRLEELAGICALGVHRAPMPRLIGLGDAGALRDLYRLVREFDIDIVHGHGAKGGAYGRVAGRLAGAYTVYTPHGGSLHYSPRSAAGMVFLNLERALRGLADAVIFESRFSQRAYSQKVGTEPRTSRVIPNGLGATEFQPVCAVPGAADVLFIGEMRTLKGPQILLRAIAEIRKTRKIRALLVGSGPDLAQFGQLASDLGIADTVEFRAPMPAREAFALARLLVVPSLAESFPYIVLEAAAAAVPMIATDVGGIPEIFGPSSERLIEAGQAGALAQAICRQLDSPTPQHGASQLRGYVEANFTQTAMVNAVAGAYSALLPSHAQAIAPISAPENAV
ncbi:MAG: glycosyltransferase [Hyphomicrobiales bacterium]